MKWDKLLAAILLIGGIGFASYSITSFVQQSSLVQEVDASQFEQHGKSTTSNSTASTMDAEEKEHWVIFPDRDRPKKGEHFADLYIPRLNSVLPIVEGTHEDELEKGLGIIREVFFQENRIMQFYLAIGTLYSVRWARCKKATSFKFERVRGLLSM